MDPLLIIIEGDYGEGTPAGAVIGHGHSNRINPVLGYVGLRHANCYLIESKNRGRNAR
jgi:hypothetical protein